MEAKNMFIVKRKVAFIFKKVATFDSEKEAINYCERILKKDIRNNKKANADLRNNSYGPVTLPWFLINEEVYRSPNDPRL